MKGQRSLQAVHNQQVVHKDVRVANMLFCKETNSVMLIDFGRAKLLDLRRLPLAPVVPNKRAWAESNPNERPKRNSERSGILNECGELRAIFR
jgi:serine/threonine protein kinase